MTNIMNDGLTRYKAPEGMVYDWAEPHTAYITELDGSVTEHVEHLYAKYLALGRYDSIDKYIVVDDPKYVKKDAE